MTRHVLVTFDIDGTMIGFGSCTINHPKAFITSFKDMYGVDASNYHEFFTEPMDGWMDARIAQWMLQKIQADSSSEGIAKFQEEIEKRFLDSAKDPIQPLPGVLHVLSELSRMENVYIGVASGNFPKIGQKKLELAGLAEFFEDGIVAFGDHFFRAEALQSAVKRAEELSGGPIDVKIHVGDTAMDVVEAKKAGFVPVFVKTGNTREGPPEGCHVISNFEDGFGEFMKLVC